MLPVGAYTTLDGPARLEGCPGSSRKSGLCQCVSVCWIATRQSCLINILQRKLPRTRGSGFDNKKHRRVHPRKSLSDGRLSHVWCVLFRALPDAAVHNTDLTYRFRGIPPLSRHNNLALVRCHLLLLRRPSHNACRRSNKPRILYYLRLFPRHNGTSLADLHDHRFADQRCILLDLYAVGPHILSFGCFFLAGAQRSGGGCILSEDRGCIGLCGIPSGLVYLHVHHAGPSRLAFSITHRRSLQTYQGRQSKGNCGVDSWNLKWTRELGSLRLREESTLVFACVHSVSLLQ